MMTDAAARAAFRVEKLRVEATITLSNGQTAHGFFFLGSSARRLGRERVDELLNAESAFFPFERYGRDETQVVLYNRDHIVFIQLVENEARMVPGYEVAAKHRVSVLLSNGHRINGTVPVHLPKGYDRLSDWARDPMIFRYVETDDATLLVNVRHVASILEVDQP